ncbi:WAT1-related protein At1g09380-like [Bidens hawaiensis]|uniref:WAT1-related protein At1g09380-like n=1 Tax=Bidens hawaiensis TaxID=980011 RepID=UPI004049E12A
MMQDLLPALLMVLVQFEFAGMNIFSKLAMDSGMNPYIHVAYRQIFASLVIVPLAYFVERGKRPPMTMPILIQIFFCSFFGLALNPITYFVGLKNTTPTIGCALSNLLPGLTFILAVAFKQENAKLKTLGGQAKLTGTILGVGGAMVLALYHGPLIPIRGSSIHLKIAASDHSDHTQWNILGPILVIVSALTWLIWFIIQARMGNKYPAPYSIAALMLLMGTVQCCVFGVIMEPRLSEWSLYPGIRHWLGVACSGIGVCIMSWCINRKGALFVSVFSPLLLVIVAALSWAFLREKLYLGTVFGSVLIVIGLYIVLWGKSKEIQCQSELQEAKEDIEMH